MPLLKPDIQAALRQVGLGKPDEESPIADRLDAADLSIDTSLRILADIAHGADKSTEKLRAIETSLKLRGLLKDQQAPPPSITIVISDPSGEHTGTNPILLPRQLANPKKEIIN